MGIHVIRFTLILMNIFYNMCPEKGTILSIQLDVLLQSEGTDAISRDEDTEQHSSPAEPPLPPL